MSDTTCKLNDQEEEDIQEDDDTEDDETLDPENITWEKCTQNGRIGWKCMNDEKVNCY